MVARETSSGSRFSIPAEGNEMVVECDHAAAAINTGLEMMPCRRAVEVVPHIIFTCPLQLHGTANFAGNPGSLNHIIISQAAAEASADARQIYVNILF